MCRSRTICRQTTNYLYTCQEDYKPQTLKLEETTSLDSYLTVSCLCTPSKKPKFSSCLLSGTIWRCKHENEGGSLHSQANDFILKQKIYCVKNNILLVRIFQTSHWEQSWAPCLRSTNGSCHLSPFQEDFELNLNTNQNEYQ